MALHFAGGMRNARRAIGAILLCGMAIVGFSGCARKAAHTSLILDDGGASPVELYERGATYLALGDLDAAEESFKASLKLAGRSGVDFAPPHEGLARILLRRGQVEEAAISAQHALDLDRHWVPTYWVLGRLARMDGNDELALVYYERGLALDPGNDEITGAAVARAITVDDIEMLVYAEKPGSRS